MSKYIIGLLLVLIIGLSLILPIGNEINPPQSIIQVGQGKYTVTIGHVAYAAGAADYVATGTNDHLIFQSALDALPSIGGQIVVLAGQYNFTGTVSRAIGNVTWVGLGYSSYLSYDGVNPAINAGSQSRWAFRNLRFDAGGLNVASATNYILENIYLGTTYYGYRLTGDLVTDRWVSSPTNTFIGQGAGGYGTLTHTVNSTGWNNTAYGSNTLYTISTGVSNTAIGTSALQKLTTAQHNTAVGVAALFALTTGGNATGGLNTAVGSGSLQATTVGYYNNAFGVDALFSNTEGVNNNAFGVSALVGVTTGSRNVAFGGASGATITTESGNVFIGNDAGRYATGSNNLYISNSDTATPLILGNFATPELITYGQFGIGKSPGARTYVSIGGEGDLNAVLTAGATDVLEPWSILQVRPGSLAPNASSVGNGHTVYIRGVNLKPPGVSPIGSTMYLEPFTEGGAGSFTLGSTLYISGESPGANGFSLYVASGKVFLNLPQYSDNTTAAAAGLPVGTLYRTGGDPDTVAVVH